MAVDRRGTVRRDDVIVEPVLHIRRFVGYTPETIEVRVVLREEQLGFYRDICIFLTFAAVAGRFAVGSDGRWGREAV